MPYIGPEALKFTPRWYQELNLGVGLLIFAVLIAYPWRGTTSAGAAIVALCLTAPGIYVVGHGVGLGRRTHWRWVKTDIDTYREFFPKERVIATLIILILALAVFLSFDVTAPTLSLRPEWWLFVGFGIGLSLAVYLGTRAKTK